MAKELEVKVLNIDKERIEERLQSIGATLLKKEHQVNTIFDTEDRRIKKEENGYLRIRESKDILKDKTEYIFTLKKNISKDELRENVEIETKIEDSKSLEEILKYLELSIKHRGTKERVSYTYENIRFDIDTWDKATYPYPYLEIEVQEKKDLERAIKLLGLNPDNVTSKSLGQLRMALNLGDI
ncbi:class IV adenylate cyclase [Sporosalibacterium faouarense]|uniref:class IV adenylate cyclase n=1 Tax=Sporosalibacterium faouarense TaxID=516123 RepID=UPI00141C20C6|nr:class IV adenylate cyclase [Sporosalibacterium faouarense]MTI49618.1 class IV adenylate cyclase [Bacillota bacterium]